mmetsp:Transcript_9463/g.19392  ORF Transcript_9463/g.19392 Transcript_9463/m.19392 type:complete len:216 (+) Transcript_9463:289-936(+)
MSESHRYRLVGIFWDDGLVTAIIIRQVIARDGAEQKSLVRGVCGSPCPFDPTQLTVSCVRYDVLPEQGIPTSGNVDVCPYGGDLDIVCIPHPRSTMGRATFRRCRFVSRKLDSICGSCCPGARAIQFLCLWRAATDRIATQLGYCADKLGIFNPGGLVCGDDQVSHTGSGAAFGIDTRSGVLLVLDCYYDCPDFGRTRSGILWRGQLSPGWVSDC